MPKTAFQAAAAKAAFQWDPNSDQTYNDSADLSLPGVASAFNKAETKTFTMDAPTQTLALQITGQDSRTIWGIGSGPAPATISVKNGTFVYDASRSTGTTLAFGAQAATTLTVENSAQFIITGGPANDGSGFTIEQVAGALTINVTDSGLLDISCAALSATEIVGRLSLAIGQKARMSLACIEDLAIGGGLVTVDSSPDAGYSLNWVANNALSVSGMRINVIVESSAILRCSQLILSGARIQASNAATCVLQFDSVSPDGSQFILGTGRAKTQFDAYSEGALPFDFLNKNYPEALFNIISGGGVNGGHFAIRAASPAAATAMVAKRLVAIDNVPQADESRLNITWDAGYATVRQKK
jgi:hypothetical protein